MATAGLRERPPSTEGAAVRNLGQWLQKFDPVTIRGRRESRTLLNPFFQHLRFEFWTKKLRPNSCQQSRQYVWSQCYSAWLGVKNV